MALVRIIILVVFSSFCNIILAQSVISGKITDHETGEIIIGANVYINNTTIGSPSNKDGQFSISNVPIGKQELVISFVGYETISYSFSSTQLPLKIDFKLKPNSKQLNEIVIKGGYKVVSNDPYYWNTFLRTFIGKTPFSDRCVIKNREDIELRLYERKGEVPVLNAVAKNPIIIVNQALGYVITYDLQFYEAKGFNRKFFGKAYFTELEHKQLSHSKIKLREAAYYGSITHFLRSLFHNTLEIEGFEVNSILRDLNPDKKRYLKLLDSEKIGDNKLRNFIINKDNSLFGDSSSHIRAVILKPDTDIISKDIVRVESLKSTDKNGQVILSSKDSLFSVIYKKPLANVIDRFSRNFRTRDGYVKSVFKLKSNVAYVVNPTVNSVNAGIGLEGFFSDFYNLSTMLPENFEPRKPKN